MVVGFFSLFVCAIFPKVILYIAGFFHPSNSLSLSSHLRRQDGISRARAILPPGRTVAHQTSSSTAGDQNRESSSRHCAESLVQGAGGASYRITVLGAFFYSKTQAFKRNEIQQKWLYKWKNQQFSHEMIDLNPHKTTADNKHQLVVCSNLGCQEYQHPLRSPPITFQPRQEA